MMKLKLLLVLAMVSPALAFADGLEWRVSGDAGWGKTSNRLNNIAKRSMVTYQATFHPGYRFGQWVAGLGLGYSFRRQLTEPSEVGATNLRGGGYVLSAWGRHDFESFFLKGGLEVFSRYALSQTDAVGQEIIYQCKFGLCGFNLAAGFSPWSAVELSSGLRYRRWGRVDVNGRENEISENRLREWSFLVEAAYLF